SSTAHQVISSAGPDGACIPRRAGSDLKVILNGRLLVGCRESLSVAGLPSGPALGVVGCWSYFKHENEMAKAWFV
ncbi:MAG: hypothetical protein N3E40_00285, partial [Dehalococcoidia bacterium]|nr:hypothetical protein [Dehalococcoidia bacterium]